jgi:hypothetical protein
MSGSYGNGPTTVLDHFRMESRYLAHQSTMRSESPVFQPEVRHDQNDVVPRPGCELRIPAQTSPAGFLESWRVSKRPPTEAASFV